MNFMFYADVFNFQYVPKQGPIGPLILWPIIKTMLFLGQNYIHIKVLEFFKNEIILNIMIFYFKMIVLAKKNIVLASFFFLST